MILIIGLGNVGSRYARTRHNIGFMVVDELAKRNDATWKLEGKLKAEIATFEIDGEKVILAKPQTMMNISGEAAQRIMQKYKVTPEAVWAVYDDVDTPFGRMRVRHGSSSGGHQGVRSLVQHIGEDFLRIKMGISLNDRSVEQSEVYVLRAFNEAEQAALPAITTRSSEIITAYLSADEVGDETTELI